MNVRTKPTLPDTPVTITEPKAPVVGLHCSGADHGQWASLWARMDDKVTTFAPDLIGTASRGHIRHGTTFTLGQEAKSVISAMEGLGAPAHLVGHSYGGALALHIARARPDLVRSLCLYEPTLFSILQTGQDADSALHREIVALTTTIRTSLEEGEDEFGAQVFTDFWGGLGAWQALSRVRRDAMVAWIKKAPSDFEALLKEHDPGSILTSDIPTTIFIGSQTHAQTRRIAELLSAQSERVQVKCLKGAGHLGPFTFREKFELEVLSHIRSVNLGQTIARPPGTGTI